MNQTLSSEPESCDMDKLPMVAFDQKNIVDNVMKQYKKGLLHRPLVFHTLPHKFILSEVIGVHEQAHKEQFDVRNFRKKILASGIISPIGEFRKSKNRGGRPVELYTMNPINKINEKRFNPI